MKELADILKALAERPESPAALATVVETEGSSYRRPGARMLILPGGRTIGSISGGCLEQDVIQHAKTITPGGESILLTYDTSSEEDVIFGAGLGCKGVVRILLEPVAPAAGAAGRPGLPGFLERLYRERLSGAAATVFAVESSAQVRLGSRCLIDGNGADCGDIADPALAALLRESACEALRTGRATTVRHETGGGAIQALAEPIHSPAPLVIFGAGYDAVSLARMAGELGYHVTIVDSRPAYAQAHRFPGADVILARPEQILEKVNLTPRTAVVIMAHNYAADLAAYRLLSPLTLLYFGLMGPRKRAEKMAHALALEGFSDTLPARVHNPIGLDIGAETPEQIALAILAEIQAVNTGHAGGLLREKKGPIHAAAHQTGARK